jgi:hypothetical protein
MREKYYWLVADKPNEQGGSSRSLPGLKNPAKPWLSKQENRSDKPV